MSDMLTFGQVGNLAHVAAHAVDKRAEICARLMRVYWHRLYWRSVSYCFTVFVIVAAVGKSNEIVLRFAPTSETQKILIPLGVFVAVLVIFVAVMAARWAALRAGKSFSNPYWGTSLFYNASLLTTTLAISVLLGSPLRETIFLALIYPTEIFALAVGVAVVGMRALAFECVRHPHVILFGLNVAGRHDRWIIDDRIGLRTVLAWLTKSTWQDSTLRAVTEMVTSQTKFVEARSASIVVALTFLVIGITIVGPAQDLLGLESWQGWVLIMVLIASVAHATLWFVNGTLRTLSILKLMLIACVSYRDERESAPSTISPVIRTTVRLAIGGLPLWLIFRFLFWRPQRRARKVYDTIRRNVKVPP